MNRAPSTFSISAYPLVPRDRAREAVEVARTVLMASWAMHAPKTRMATRSLPAPFGFPARRLTVNLQAEEPNEEQFILEAAKMLTVLQHDRPLDAWLLLGATSYPNHPFLAQQAGAHVLLPAAMLEPLSKTHKKTLQPKKVSLLVRDLKRRTGPDPYMDPNRREERMDFLAFSQWEPALDFAQPYFRAIALDQAWQALGPAAAACPRRERL